MYTLLISSVGYAYATNYFIYLFPYFTSGFWHQEPLCYCYRGASIIAKTVKIVCEAIWNFHTKKINIPKITTEQLTKIVENFTKSANFSNCIVTFNGKHVMLILEYMARIVTQPFTIIQN